MHAQLFILHQFILGLISTKFEAPKLFTLATNRDISMASTYNWNKCCVFWTHILRIFVWSIIEIWVLKGIRWFSNSALALPGWDDGLVFGPDASWNEWTKGRPVSVFFLRRSLGSHEFRHRVFVSNCIC